MILSRTILLLAVSAMLATATSPAFAQHRDSRGETEQPHIENGEGDGEIDKPAVARLPRGAEGTSCVADSLDLSVGFGVNLENETGKVIPKGTVITLYVQPGNIQRLLELNFDWKPGAHLSYTFFGDYSDLSLPMECSFKLSPGRGPAEPKFEIPVEEPKRQIIPKWEIKPTERYIPAKPDFVKAELECTPYTWGSFDGYFMKFVGPEPDGLPPGTVIYWQTLPDGKIHQLTFTNGLPAGKVMGVQSLDGDLPIGAQGQLPDCQVWAM